MKSSSIEILSVETLLAKQFPPADTMLGGNMLDKAGALLISGPQKVGKSLFATQLALSLAGGQEFLGFRVGASGYRVLILQAEVSEKRMQERFSKQVRAFPEAAQRQILSACVYSSIKLDDAEGVSTVHAWVDEHKPDLLVVDPLSNFHSGDENVAQDMSRITSVLDDIRAKDVAVVLIHHHGKTSGSRSNVGHKARGSSVLPGWYDSHMSLEWAEPQRTVRLRFELRHDEVPEDMVLRLNSQCLIFEPQSDESSQVSLVVGIVRDTGRTDAESVGSACGRTRQWASEWLNRAADQEKLVRTNGRPVVFALPGQLTETVVDVRPEQVVLTTNSGGGAFRA